MTPKSYVGMGCLGCAGFIFAGGWITGIWSILGFLMGFDGAPDHVVAPDRTIQIAGQWMGFSPDATLCVTANASHALELRNVTDGTIARTLPAAGDEPGAISFSADGRLLASTSSDGLLRLWRVADGTLLQRIEVPVERPAHLRAVALSPDGQYVVAGAVMEASLHLFRTSDGKLLDKRTDHRYEVLGWTHDGLLMASGTWRVTHDKLILERAWEPELAANADVWPDQNCEWIATHEAEGLRVQHLRTGQSHVWKMPNWSNSPITWTPDGQRLAIRFQTGDSVKGPHIRSFVEVRRARDGALLHMMQVGTSKNGTDTVGTSMLISADGKWLAINFRDGTVGLWDMSAWITPIPEPPSPHQEGHGMTGSK